MVLVNGHDISGISALKSVETTIKVRLIALIRQGFSSDDIDTTDISYTNTGHKIDVFKAVYFTRK